MTEKKSIFEKPLLSTKVKSANVKLPEIIFGYFIGPIGALLASGIFTSFLNNYWTEILFKGQITEGVQRFLTLLPLLSAAFIVAGNLIAGQLIEKTKTRAGKARPWILLSSVLSGLSCILMFICPSDDPVVKMVLTAISYNLYYAIAYPLYNTANSTLIPVSTRSAKQRGLLASATNVAGLAVMGAGSMVFPIIAGMFLGSQGAWTFAFVIVGVVTFVACVLQYYFTRERVTEENFYISDKKEKLPVAKQLKAVASDKYWWIIIVFYLLFQFSGAIKNLSMVYFCEKIVDNSFWGATLSPETAAGMTQTLLAVLGAIPMALAVVIIWPLSNKFGKQTVTIVGLIIGVVGGALAGAFPDNVIMVATGVALKCLGSSPACYMILAMLSDVLDHIEAESGFRCDGLTMSIYSSIMVAATPVGQAVFNFISGSGQNLAALTVSYVWVETVAFAICAVLIIFFTVENKLASDQAKILKRQKEAIIAAGGEWIEPVERLRKEQEEADKAEYETALAELKVKCNKKGLDFEKEKVKFDKKQKIKKS